MRWPEACLVRAAAEAWARAITQSPGVVAVGLFGSLARGGWGVGSDADLVVVVEASDASFLSRAQAFPADVLPVPADVLVYTVAEWAGPALVTARRDVQWLAGDISSPPPVS